MYQFINDYPRDKENHFSEEIQGVCHDDKYWFFTQDGSIWKIPVQQDLNQDFKSKSDPSKDVTKVTPKGHLGDMDYYDGHIFIADQPSKDSQSVKVCDAIEGAPYISVYKASDLSFVCRWLMSYHTRAFTGIGWCAINNGFLYTSESTICGQAYPIYIYKIEKNDKGIYSLVDWGTVIPKNDDGTDIYFKDMQGGCFDDQNRLHIANGLYGYLSDDDTEVRKREGISVFQLPAAPVKGKTYHVTRIAKSQQKGGFEYKFDTYGQEPEGLTWWDLDGRTDVPGIEGKLHVLLLNNDGNKDNFWFKHYRRLPQYDKKPLSGRSPIRRPIKRASPNE